MKTVALIWGGAGKEHDVSRMGYPYVMGLLKRCGYRAVSVYIDNDALWSVVTENGKVPAFPIRLADKRGLLCNKEIIEIDAAIPLLHGDKGEDGEVQGLLECAGIRYIGADVCTSALCLDKEYTKVIARSLGIPTAKSVGFTRPTDAKKALELCLKSLNFPMFIKPRRLGSSVGAAAVGCAEEFIHAFKHAMAVGRGFVTVEELIEEKRELECAFYEALGTRVISPPSEILCEGFYGYGEKYEGKTRTAVKAEVDESTKQTLQGYCSLLADALALRHLARIDFFLTPRGILFNEINTFPGFTDDSLYPRMLESVGIPPHEALASFIEDALC